jgi:hypothetical protein
MEHPVSFSFRAIDRSRQLVCCIPLVVASPAEPRLASNFSRISVFGLAEEGSPTLVEGCRAAQPATKLQLLPNFASPCHAEDEFSDFPRISHPATRAARPNLRLLSNLSSSCWAGNVLSDSLLVTD